MRDGRISATFSDLKMEQWLRRRERGEIIWTTRDGMNIPIKEMSDQHLDSTINMLRRNSNDERAQMEALGSIGGSDYFF